MKRLASLCLFAIIVLTLAAGAPAQNPPPPAAGSREVLTNESIISLAKAHFKEQTIISLIRSSPTAFDLSTAKLIELKRRGVSERIVTEMIQRQSYAAAAQDLGSLRDDEFFKLDDDAFFKSAPLPKASPGDKGTKPDETPVFGSRSGTKSKTRSRGMGANGESSGESEVGGTATVRLIRPPSEEGGGPKLERAPKLDNQAIIDLVQAGFSEGTVLRKIENTQVEFDVSPKALSELRKNRVSERIIKAMTEAMDESKTSK